MARFLHDCVLRVVNFANRAFLLMLALVHVPLVRDVFPMSLGPAPVQAEFSIYIVDGSYWVMALVLYKDRVGDRP